MSRPKGKASDLEARRVKALRQLREGKPAAEVAAEAGVHVNSGR